MKVDMIDLEEFFSDKYRFAVDIGIGATGIITQSQMVTRFNSKSGYIKGKQIIKGDGNHFTEEGKILHDIFGFDEQLFLGFGYNPLLYDKLDKEHKKVLGEPIVVKYINNSTGNTIIIYLPLNQESLTDDQLAAIKYLNDCVEEASTRISKPIFITATDRHKRVKEINSLRNIIIPFLEKHIDNTYEQSVPDQNIIAQNEIKPRSVLK